MLVGAGELRLEREGADRRRRQLLADFGLRQPVTELVFAGLCTDQEGMKWAGERKQASCGAGLSGRRDTPCHSCRSGAT